MHRQEARRVKNSRHSAEQLAFAPHQAEGGTPVSEIGRKLGVSEQTYYRWKNAVRPHTGSLSSSSALCLMAR